MDIRYLLFFFIIVIGYVMGVKSNSLDAPKNYIQRKRYVIFCSLLIIIESCLRGYSVGNDTFPYYEEFQIVKSASWDQIFYRFIETSEGTEKDPGFWVLVKLFQFFFDSFRLFLFAIGIWFFYFLGKILLRFTKDFYQLTFAFVLFVALFNIVVLSGVRQQIATGFSFWAFLLLADGKKVRAILIIFLGMTMHITCSIMLTLLLFGYLKKYIKKIHFASFFAIPLVIQFGGLVALFLASLSPNEYYSSYGDHEADNGSWNYVLCITAASVFALLSLKKDFINSNICNTYLYATMPLATFLAPLIMQGPSLIRLGQYFTLFFMVIIPKSVDYFTKNKSNRASIYVLLILFLLIMSLKSGFNYYFWFTDPRYNF